MVREKRQDARCNKGVRGGLDRCSTKPSMECEEQEERGLERGAYQQRDSYAQGPEGERHWCIQRTESNQAYLDPCNW